MLERIKDIRKSLGLNQTEFAKRIGITQTAYSMIESGSRQLSDKHIKIISSEFGINENWLRTGAGEMQSNSPYEKEFMRIFDSLTSDSQDYLLIMARELLNTQKKILENNKDK